ncbi:MAG: choice-of-anchor D domain-containing protein [Rudaea sp.]|uniref:NHL domain-containing protein n=1 Tax=Rudaea sp. TaxID=2136325 RepID=UPI0039E4694D
MAIDSAGNLYLADRYASVIRKVDKNGVASVVAGNGTAGYAGDGGAATSAQLDFPAGVAVDDAGNLYIADTNNNVIRKVDANGIITTSVGTGVLGFYGDGGPATDARLNAPQGVAISANGDLYIADTGNSTIRKVETITPTIRIISLVAGRGGVQGYYGDYTKATVFSVLDRPAGVSVGTGNDIFIADTGNHVIRHVDTAGIITTYAGNHTAGAGYSGDGGPAVAAKLSYPLGTAVDADGSLYIADSDLTDNPIHSRVRKVSAAAFKVGGTVSGLAGSGLVLSLNHGAQFLAIAGNGAFAFRNALVDGSTYEVSVQTPPAAPAQTCSVTNASGTLAGADITDVAVNCAIATHTVTPILNGSGASIDPSTPQTVDDGATTSFVITADTGRNISSLTIVTGCGGHLIGNTFTTDPITADCTVTANLTTTTGPVDGVCGSDDGKTLSAPPVNLCNSGLPSAVNGNGPWTWSCAGSNGGAMAQCSADIAQSASYTISVAANPAGAGTVTCTPNPVAAGGSSTCTAAANAGYTFAAFSGDCSGASCTLSNVTANQSVVANFSATGQRPGTISVRGIANGDTTPSAADGTDFGSTAVGAPVAHAFTIDNAGARAASLPRTTQPSAAAPQADGDLIVVSITSNNPAFTVSGGTGTIAANASASFDVRFSAGAAGTQTATITIASNDGQAPIYTFAVSAAAVATAAGGVQTAPALSNRMLGVLGALLCILGLACAPGCKRAGRMSGR